MGPEDYFSFWVTMGKPALPLSPYVVIYEAVTVLARPPSLVLSED
jgi:hypothetical protein